MNINKRDNWINENKRDLIRQFLEENEDDILDTFTVEFEQFTYDKYDSRD